MIILPQFSLYEYEDRSDTFSRTEFEKPALNTSSSVLDKTEWGEKVQGNLRNLKENFIINRKVFSKDRKNITEELWKETIVVGK